MKFLVVAAILIFVLPVFGQNVTSELRDQYLRTAQVWHPVNVSKMDVTAGPRNDISVPPLSEVSCRYEEPKEKQPGAARKFLCKLPDGQIARVKYGKESREMYAEVAASRLFWALGFYADKYYPVRLRCLGCPEADPSNPAPEEKRIDQLLEFAIIERKFPGESIEEQPDQGWKWTELENVSPEAGGAPREQIDALRLLAVFVQHADSGAANQRLACFREDLEKSAPDAPLRCRRPVLMIQDLGSTFGSGTDVLSVSKMSLTDWQSQPIWDTKAEAEFTLRNGVPVCLGKLTSARAAGEDGLNNPAISEQGRKFLADLLNKLSLQQIVDLFRVAGVDRRDEYLETEGVKKKITAEDWAAVFIKKRTEINEAKCPVLSDAAQ